MEKGDKRKWRGIWDKEERKRFREKLAEIGIEVRRLEIEKKEIEGKNKGSGGGDRGEQKRAETRRETDVWKVINRERNKR